MTEAEAYRRWHANEKARQKYLRTLRQVGHLIEGLTERIAADAAAAQERHIRDLANRLGRDKAFLRTLKAYTGHTPHGWIVACGCDGRMKGLIRLHGWDTLKEVIRRVRYANMFFKHMREEPRDGTTIGDIVDAN